MNNDTSNNQDAPRQIAKPSVLKNPWVRGGGLIFLVLILAGGLLYWLVSSTEINIDNSQISAPTVDLSPASPGILQEVYVKTGDQVPPNTPVARVGDEIIKTKTPGLIIATQNDIGKIFNPGTPVVTVIDPTELRVVGQIEENKGLTDIHLGQHAVFTVDAFSGKSYQGVVDEISSTSHESSVVFNISDKRATQIFDIKIRYNIDSYPELKNGMSAKITIYK